MSKTSVLELLSVALLVGCSCTGASGQDAQFFANDMLPLQSDPYPYLYATFMQHSRNSTETDYLHSGIDIAGNAGSEVFSANVDWGGDDNMLAQLVFVDAENKRLLLAKKNYVETVALVLGHVEPLWSAPQDFNHSSWIASVEDRGEASHVHANLYENFYPHYVWDHVHHQPQDYQPRQDIDLRNLEPFLVNPATNAFEELKEPGGWLEDTVSPTISDFDVHRVTNCHWWQDCYRAVVRAYDSNNKLDAAHSVCNPGVYRIVFYVDGDSVDAIDFEKWSGDAADFYLNPDSPPDDNCNEWDALYYFLEWGHYDEENHDFLVKVCDAAGKCEKMMTLPTGESPPLALGCKLEASRIRIRWQIPDRWGVRQFDLYRSTVEGERGLPVNDEGIATVDEKGFRILGYEYVDDAPLSPDWEKLFYTLEGIGDDGKTRTLGSGVVSNPLWLTGELRVLPNPFSGRVSVGFANPYEGDVRVSVYDVTGRLVKGVANTRLSDGWVEYQWDGRDSHGLRVAPGIYFVAVTRGDDTRVTKITLVK